MSAGRIPWARWAPGIIVGAFAVLWAARWPIFPLSVDPYYHLFIAKEMLLAGGPMAYEWWEYAPVGRPHLYPPALHMFLGGGLALGIGDITMLRLASVSLVPLLIASIYLAMRRLCGRVIGLSALCVSLLPFSYLLHAAITLAATLALIELLWLLVAVREERVVAAGALLGLLFYTHLGLSWVAVAALCSQAVVGPNRKVTLSALLLGLILAAPWLMHLARHWPWLQPVARVENEALELSGAVWVAAVGGLAQCVRHPRFRWLLGLPLAFGLFLPRFAFRWASGEGVVPIVLLGGLGLGRLAEWWSQRRPGRAPLAFVCALTLAAAMTPTILVSAEPASGYTVRAAWADSGLWHLAGAARRAHPLQMSVYHARMADLARDVAGLLGPRQILWSNAPYAAGLLGALAERPTSSAMLYEVAPAQPLDVVGAAHLIVWFRVPTPDLPPLPDMIRRYRLFAAGEGELAVLLRNPAPGGVAHAPRRALPWSVAGVLLCGVLGMVGWDFCRLRARGAV